MYVNSPMCSDAIAVFGGWVTFVRVPAVVRMLLVVFEHEVISSYRLSPQFGVVKLFYGSKKSVHINVYNFSNRKIHT